MRPLSTYWRVYYLQLGASPGRGKHPPCPVDTTLEDADTVDSVRVLHTPGHLAFWWPESRVLFAGDAIAIYPVFGPGWPAFMLNPTQHRASLRRMAELDTAVLAVGHGDPLTAGAAERVRSLVEGR
ncbi:MAG: MBL fold metallo-hydrolase [Actinomycetota bacterium]|nr:MBL fold metallo-hydrolase [Actinomycetota bacterium]